MVRARVVDDFVSGDYLIYLRQQNFWKTSFGIRCVPNLE